MSLSAQIIEFYSNLEAPGFLPEGIEAMDPYSDLSVMTYVGQFYSKYFSDINPRVMLVGINPGRFGGGLTGIPFTDPILLQETCGIVNSLDKRNELSSRFIYSMIEHLGGPDMFYRSFYVTAVSPLGFTKEGKNINYYDDSELQEEWEPFMLQTLKKQIKICGNPGICFSLGQGKNYKYLRDLSVKHSLFSDVKPLPHPRWVMQYRLKRKQEFIQLYKKQLTPFMNGH